MCDDDEIVIAYCASFIITSTAVVKRKRKRRWWRTILFENRKKYSGSDLMDDLQAQLIYGQFENFTRMSAEDFEWLLNNIRPAISKQDTHFRESIPAKERLAVTLRYLATGDSYISLSYLFKFSKKLISTIIPVVCAAITYASRDIIKIIHIKKKLKQAKVQLIHKLTRKADGLKNQKKPPPEHLKAKIQRKADAALAEVLIIKKVKPKDLVRFVISHKGTLQQHLNKPSVDNEKVFAKILLHKSMSEKYSSIREKFANMPAEELLMTRKERLKLKKERNETMNQKGKNHTTHAKKVDDEKSDEFGDSAENYDGILLDVCRESETALEKSSDEESQEVDESECNESGNEDSDANKLKNTKPLIKRKHKKPTENKLEVDNTELNIIKTLPKQKETKRVTGSPEKNITKKPIIKKKNALKQNNKKPNKPNPKHRIMELNENAQEHAKVVDSFFLTSSGDHYMTLAEPRAPDEVKEEHHRGNRRMRRAEKFGKPIKSFKPSRNNFENDSSSYSGSKYEKPLKNTANKKDNMSDCGFSKRNFNISKTNNKSLSIESKKTDLKEEKLHPSWEAKKQKSGIVAFQGKKVVF